MSTLAVNTITNAAGGNTAQINGMTPTGLSLQGFRNRIFNGNMVIAQRGTTGTFTGTNNYLLDRFAGSRYGGFPDNMTQEQVADSPSGFSFSYKLTNTSATTTSAAQGSGLRYQVEGQDISDLAFGTASAKQITVSFWVKSNQTGNFALVLTNSAGDYGVGKLYNIALANTWEFKTVVFPAPTAGTFASDNTTGLTVNWGFAGGADRVANLDSWAAVAANSKTTTTGASNAIGETLGATWQITGVQLEAGAVATPFERRPFGTELALCQRYYYRITAESTNREIATGFNSATTEHRSMVFFPVTMRVAPTALEQSGTAANYSVTYLTTSSVLSSVPSIRATGNTPNSTIVACATSGLTAGQGAMLRITTSGAYLAWSAEL